MRIRFHTKFLSSPYYAIAGFVAVIALFSYVAYGNFARKAQLQNYAAESKPRMIVFTEYHECISGFNSDPAEYCLIQAAAFASLKLPDDEADKAALELARFMNVDVPLLERKVGGALQDKG